MEFFIPLGTLGFLFLFIFLGKNGFFNFFRFFQEKNFIYKNSQKNLLVYLFFFPIYFIPALNFFFLRGLFLKNFSPFNHFPKKGEKKFFVWPIPKHFC